MVIEKYILDPLSVIVKLAILAKKPIGCKIAINNNIIYIQEVGVFQSLVRYLYNNNKNDIQYLYNPIELACKNYLSKECVKIYPNIKNLFIDAIKGLEKLKETYSHNMIITHTLYLYCSIINNYLGEVFNNNLFIVDDITDKYNSNIRNLCFNTWTNTTQSEKTIKKLKSNDNLTLTKSNKKQIISQCEDDDNTTTNNTTTNNTTTNNTNNNNINNKLLKKQEKGDKQDKLDKLDKLDKQDKLDKEQILLKEEQLIKSDANLQDTKTKSDANFQDTKVYERIKIILNMIDFIDKDTEYDKSVKCLEEFMTIIDQEIKIKIEAINLDFLNKEIEKKISL